MSYKAIATVIFDEAQAKAVLRGAIELARHTGADMQVICVGIDQTDIGYYYVGAQAIAVQQNQEVAAQEAHKLQALAQETLQKSGVVYDISVTTIAGSALGGFTADVLRFSDAAVLVSPYQAQSNSWDVAVFEACLFGARCPIFMVPYDASAQATNFGEVMIAWDDGAQALAAVRAARPLLGASVNASVAMVDPAPNAPDRSDPGGRLVEVLTRYGAQVGISVLAKSDLSIAKQLLHHADKQRAGFIVMGAYKHSRLREAILGGTTRDILRLSKIPVLLAH